MKKGITSASRFVELDVHAETIAVSVAERDGGEVRVLGTIPNREESTRKLVGNLGPTGSWKAPATVPIAAEVATVNRISFCPRSSAHLHGLEA